MSKLRHLHKTRPRCRYKEHAQPGDVWLCGRGPVTSSIPTGSDDTAPPVGDLAATTVGQGVILTDDSNGHTYRLNTHNGEVQLTLVT